MKAAIVFTDDVEHPLARCLRRGYRHVMCIVPDDRTPGTSLLIDMTVHGLVVTAVEGEPEDAALFYRRHGLEAWLVPYAPWKSQLLPILLNNCVGLTKQVVGIRGWALTPWQLRKLLAKQELHDDLQVDTSGAGRRLVGAVGAVGAGTSASAS